MKLLKILAILIVGTVSTLLAVHFTEKYAVEALTREKTLAEAIIQGQLSAELEKAEEQASDELGDAFATAVVSLREQETSAPAETTMPATEEISLTTITTITFETTTVTTTGTAAPEKIPEKIVTEFTRGGILPTDRTGIPIKTMFGLSADEQNRVIGFLIEHYFLNGDIYVKAEKRPELKEKKQLANEMEKSVIRTLNMILDSVNISDISSLMDADFGKLKNEVIAIRDEFEKKYRNASDYGEEFGAMYEDSLVYFNRLIKALERIETVRQEYLNSTNPLLAIGLLTSALNDVVIPEIMAVLEQSFDLVETSQEIFLEGTQGTKLLSRDEVKDIIVNPAVILDTGLA